MRLLNIIKIIIITLSYRILIPTPLYAVGGWSGNGGSPTTDVNNIWFMGADPIPYCLFVSSDIMAVDAVHEMIKINNERWRIFFKKYAMDQQKFGENNSYFKDRIPRGLSLDFALAPNCSEVKNECLLKESSVEQCHEALKDKVLFLIGEPNKVIKNYLSNNGKVDAISLRTNYNHDSLRSGGIVWIKKLKNGGWSTYSHLLLHEMGHVFGMKHDSCWVMASNVSDNLQLSYGVAKLETIESPSWPYSFKKGDFILFTDYDLPDNEKKGFIPIKNLYPRELFKELDFNENNLFQVRGYIEDQFYSRIKIKIEIEEYPTGKIHTLSGTLDNPSPLFEFPLVPQLFTKWYSNSNNSEPNFNMNYLNEGFVSPFLQGTLDWKDGVKVPITLRRDKGLKLGMYFPMVSQWLNLEGIKK